MSRTNSVAIRRLKDLFNESSFFKGLGIDVIELFKDLSLYNYDSMVVGSMSLINRYFSGHDNLFKRAVQAQILVNERSCQVLKEVNQLLPVMRRLTASKMTNEQTNEMNVILKNLVKLCTLENESEEPHPMNQTILYNHGILSDIFGIFAQQIDAKLMEQYSGIKSIFENSFVLLKSLARGNETVQRRLFDRLDKILEIEGAEPQLADALIEVFTGNKDNCMKILSYQIQKVMSIVAKQKAKAPQFLDLLNAVVKVEELNLPLKRNQSYVMKYFMQYRSDIAYVVDQSPENRKKLLVGTGQDVDYLASMVDLLATCAEGENQSIESQCQTIFTVPELMDILNSPEVDNGMKRPYLRFLLWVYLNTAGGISVEGQGEVGHLT